MPENHPFVERELGEYNLLQALRLSEQNKYQDSKTRKLVGNGAIFVKIHWNLVLNFQLILASDSEHNFLTS